MKDLWKFKNCPFCGSDKIAYGMKVLSYNDGKDCPFMKEVKVWGWCQYCEARSGSMIVDVISEEEIKAAAIEKWNKRYE